MCSLERMDYMLVLPSHRTIQIYRSMWYVASKMRNILEIETIFKNIHAIFQIALFPGYLDRPQNF